jgi:UDP-N-acetylmuramate--alanine ligase
MNALMAIAMAVNFGTNRCHCSSLSFIQRSPKTIFVSNKTDNLVYIDDYAHHPTEIMQCIRRLENCIQNKSSHCFQPIYLVEQDFADDFAKSLSNFDEV